MPKADLAERVLRWQQAHGRRHLPWQGTRDPYRVWLSEIMLQQTQVATVLDYYQRFLARFPDVQALAGASQEEVLALWSGLGYYSRARNLHRCAQRVVAEHGGVFPASAAQLAQLPGIGRSTAGAIAAFCHGERAPILDANVRRVLTRVLGFAADLSQAANERALWALAQELLPPSDLARNMPLYTQGLMDLGAGVCTARKPDCARCPLAELCVARRQGRQEEYPVRSRRVQRRREDWWLLLCLDAAGRCWLAPRPQHGIWAGLHCPPVAPSRAALDALLAPGAQAQEWPPFAHMLTHRELCLHPVLVRGPAPQALPGAWFAPQQWQALGLPAPVRKLLAALPGLGESLF
ncbi:A/G-specific adenine glycosylase [Comamonas sp. NLF-1-9]|uniref:A/G-specific adenine glycosylase n=1 Tax=Comamonas sp. NLF-1-9 TaxID=2853163 RepID=UPI001C44FD2F|nr:A/G-specific adenine glycosylase [Comamonas sp. NLF-1-9]QXL85573.1 A/G-specific adenine glycosylase [Comamonas sp. NLF-1-9]